MQMVNSLTQPGSGLFSLRSYGTIQLIYPMDLKRLVLLLWQNNGSPANSSEFAKPMPRPKAEPPRHGLSSFLTSIAPVWNPAPSLASSI